MACDRSQHFVQRLFDSATRAMLHEIGTDAMHEFFNVPLLRTKAGNARTRTAAGPVRSISRPTFRSDSPCSSKASASAGATFSASGTSSGCDAMAPDSSAAFHSLVCRAFVRGVHVDQNQSIGRLRQYVDAVQLCDRIAERRRDGSRRSPTGDTCGRSWKGRDRGSRRVRDAQSKAALRTGHARATFHSTLGRQVTMPCSPAQRPPAAAPACVARSARSTLRNKKVVYVARIAKAHFELRRMRVHVDLRRVELEEQHICRVSTMKQHIAIAHAHGIRLRDDRASMRPFK